MKYTSLSRWKIFGLVILTAFIATIYVSNVIRIDELLEEVDKIEAKALEVKHNNDVLRAKLNKMQAPERITSIAREKLGMKRATKPPEIIPND